MRRPPTARQVEILHPDKRNSGFNNQGTTARMGTPITTRGGPP